MVYYTFESPERYRILCNRGELGGLSDGFLSHDLIDQMRNKLAGKASVHGEPTRLGIRESFHHLDELVLTKPCSQLPGPEEL